jgi:hypothetical protein
MPVRSAFASPWRIPSANELQSPEEFGMQTTGVREPAVRNGAAEQHQIEIADLELLDRVSDRTCRYNDISSGSQIRTLRRQLPWIEANCEDNGDVHNHLQTWAEWNFCRQA